MERIADLFINSVLRCPEKIAVYSHNEQITYNDLFKKSQNYCYYLHSMGVRKGDHIGVPMENDISSISLFIAASFLGIAIIAANPTMPVESMMKMFNTGDAKYIVINQDNISNKVIEKIYKTSKLPLINISNHSQNNHEDNFNKYITASGKENFILTTTSGTTGDFKQICLTQNNKIERIKTVQSLYNIVEEDVILISTPLYHSLAERFVLAALLYTGTAVILSEFSAYNWLKQINEKKVTIAIPVSSQLNQISELLTSPFLPDLNSLRCVISSSDYLENHTKKELMKYLRCSIHEIYGTSEISIATDIDLFSAPDKYRSVGKAISGVNIKILKQNDSIASTNEIGEILVETKTLFSGYYGNIKETQKAMKGEYFKTGDLGYVDADGYLYFQGRMRDIIKVGSINVYPVEIEQRILENTAVKECSIYEYYDERQSVRIGLAIVIKDGMTINEKELREYCKETLSDVEQPSQISILDIIPRNNLGKIDKRKLIELIGHFKKNDSINC